LTASDHGDDDIHSPQGWLHVRAGRRGSRVIPAGFDWHLLVGDDTALPMIVHDHFDD
jgi:hypothetical protein